MDLGQLGNIGSYIVVALAILGALPALLFAIVAFLRLVPGNQFEDKLEAVANWLQKLVNAIPKK